MKAWMQEEYEEKIGQAAKLIQMFDENPADAAIWEKLLAWKEDHKSFISGSYDEPEEKGFDISSINQV